MKRWLSLIAAIPLATACAPSGDNTESDGDDSHESLVSGPPPLAYLSGRSEVNRLLLSNGGTATHFEWFDERLVVSDDSGVLLDTMKGWYLPKESVVVTRDGDADFYGTFANRYPNGSGSVYFSRVHEGSLTYGDAGPTGSGKLLAPDITLAKDGASHLVWGFGDSDGKTHVWTSRCIGVNACQPKEVDAVPSGIDVTYAIDANDANGAGPIVAIGASKDATPAEVRVLSKQGETWKVTSTISGLNDLLLTKLELHRGFGRTVLAMTGHDASNHDVTRIWELERGAWTELVRLDYVGTAELRLTEDFGVVALASRCFHSTKPESGCDDALWRMYRETEGFRARALVPSESGWVYLETNAIGPDGKGYEYRESEGGAAVLDGDFATWSEPAASPRGAGTLVHGDPCLQSGPIADQLYASRWLVTGNVKGGYGGTLSLPGGLCVVNATISLDGATWKLDVKGTPDRPVHFLNAKITSSQGAADVTMANTFLEETTLGIHSSPSDTAPALTRIDLDHVSWQSGFIRQVFDQPDFEADDPSGIPSRAKINVVASAIGPTWGDAPNGQPFLDAEGFTDLVIDDTDFFGAGSGIRLVNEGYNQVSLSMKNSRMLDAGAGVSVEVSSDLDAIHAKWKAITASVGPLETPVTIDGLTYEGRRGALAALPADGIYLQRAVGSIHATHVSNSTRDGIALVDVAHFEITDGSASDNAGHGIHVTNEVPADLGPCVHIDVPPDQGPPVFVAPPDPIVVGNVIHANGQSGIEVDYAHTPMDVRKNEITDNVGEGFAIRHGQGLSQGVTYVVAKSCFYADATVDLPLSPETRFNDNTVLGNGAGAGGVQLFSDHRVGTLDATNDCWGTANPAEVQVSCTGECTWQPIASCEAQAPTCSTSHLVISEIKSRGVGGASDEFVELFNPTNQPITLDASFRLEGRSTSSGAFTTRFTGTGATIPAGGHYLLVGAGYANGPLGDAKLTSGITDATALRLASASTVVDTVCYYFDAVTKAKLDATFGCEGSPANNAPHDNTTKGTSNSNLSLQRGGAGCDDTNDNAADFTTAAPASPTSSKGN